MCLSSNRSQPYGNKRFEMDQTAIIIILPNEMNDV